MSLSGAMTTGGLGMAAIISAHACRVCGLMVSTGANLLSRYHFGIGLQMRRGLHNLDDRVLREEGVVSDLRHLLSVRCLLKTDQFFREMDQCARISNNDEHFGISHLAGKICAGTGPRARYQGQISPRGRT